MLSKLNDIELIEACKNGSRKHQQLLYQKYYPLMSNIALRYSSCIEDAEEGINFGFLKVINSIANYDKQFALATFIRTILVRHFIDIYRKNNSIKKIELVPLSDFNEQHVTNLGYENLTSKDLLDIINKLPSTQKTVFNLFAVDGYSHAEIAEMINCSESTSRWHLNQARIQLKKSIESQTQTYLKIVNTP